MRFGKHLEAEKDPLFEGRYVPYKQLKKVIKASGEFTPDVAPQPEFHQVFHENLESAMASIDQLIMEVLDTFPEQDEVERLAKYAELNALGTVKIVKKYRKHLRQLECMPEDCHEIQKFLLLPGLTRLATMGFPTSMEIFQERLLQCHIDDNTNDAGRNYSATGQAQMSAISAELRAPVAELPPASGIDHDAAPASLTDVGVASRGRAHRETMSFASVFWTFLPELIISGCGVLCWLVAYAVNLLYLQGFLALAGVLLLMTTARLLHSKLMIWRQPPPPPPRVRVSIWALATFGQLSAGTTPALAIEMVSAVQEAGLAAQMPASAPPALTFTHKPRLEQTDCPCCMQDFSEATRVAVVPCGHIFCESCLRSWAMTEHTAGGSCPVCRACFELCEP